MKRFAFLVLFLGVNSAFADWRTADKSSAGIAPSPAEEPLAVVQVYYARAYSWRGTFGVHSWIATKEANAVGYTTYHVIGWQLRRSDTSVVIQENAIPDGRWYGSEPTLLRDIRGSEAESAIAKIKAAAKEYPHGGTYHVWPGPNSNTFISYLIRHTPEIGVELPPHAIGKDWLANYWPIGKSESNTGFQVSLYGLLGFTLGLNEGVEVNLLGLSFGLDLYRPAIKLPLAGRLGMKDEAL